MKLVIVGGKKVVYFLAKDFISKGYDVAIVNKDPDYCRSLSQKLNALIINGDASKQDVLAQAEADKADAILALTGNDSDNLFICQLAQKKFEIENTFAMVNNPDNEEIFKKLGIETIFNTTRLLSLLIEQRVETSDVSNLLSIEEGRVNISQVILDEDSPVLGQSLKEINLPEDIVFGCVIRGEEVLIPRGNTRLLAGDKVLLITLPERQAEAFSALTSEN